MKMIQIMIWQKKLTKFQENEVTQGICTELAENFASVNTRFW